MKKVLILCCVFLVIFMVGCGKKEKTKAQKIMVEDFELKEKTSKEVNGNLSVKITLKNTSTKEKEIPEFYVSLLDKNNLVITNIENSVKEKVFAGESITFELMTQVPYGDVSDIEYHEKKQEN